jgi:hypothetical protein
LDRFGNYIAQRVIALTSSQEEERLQALAVAVGDGHWHKMVVKQGKSS